MSQDWKYGICSCCETPSIYFWACCIPCGSLCMQMMAISNVSDDKNAGLLAIRLICRCGHFGAALNRHKIREELGIRGSLCTDLLFHCFCDTCAYVQEYRHVMSVKHGDDKRPPWQVR